MLPVDDLDVKKANGLLAVYVMPGTIWVKNIYLAKNLINCILNKWRRDGDSNPGEALTPTRFPSVRLKPLGHLS